MPEEIVDNRHFYSNEARNHVIQSGPLLQPGEHSKLEGESHHADPIEL